MQFTLSSALCATLLLLDQASAAPTTHSKSKKAADLTSYRINRVPSGRTLVRNGKSAYVKAFAKYGMPLPEDYDVTPTIKSKINAAASGQTGVVTNEPTPGDVEFISPVTIGGQTIPMDFDTGSSDLWVFSTSLPADSQTGHTVFDPTKSTTFLEMAGATYNISFGDGSQSAGIVGTDTVDIGGATVTSQAVELATSVSPSFVQDTASNGLVGLAFSKLNTVKPTQQKTFFDNVSSTLAKPIIAANLKTNAPGFYEFGFIDSSQFSGNLTTIPIDSSQGFWQFPATAFQVGTTGLQTNIQNSPAIADTGTTLLIVDESVAHGLYSQVADARYEAQAGGIVFPCNSTVPDLTMVLGTEPQTYAATIPGQLLNFVALGDGSGFCFGAVQSNQGQKIQILGDILFKSQFVVFDNQGLTISMAPHAI
ncbi:hypothetical protein MMC25_006625 [Agyrium rufum]|nr:hypothetical protein [Agyrium rufum]